MFEFIVCIALSAIVLILRDIYNEVSELNDKIPLE